MFWITHIQNYVNDNVAVGSRVGFWFINHNFQSNFNPPLAPFRNNRASGVNTGLMMESNVEEREPTSSRKRAQFSKIGGRQNSSPNGNPLEACYPVVFDGWNIQHTWGRGVWIRQSSVVFKNAQFSDNAKAMIYPTSDCPGQTQTIQDSVFVGFSANYGNPPPDYKFNERFTTSTGGATSPFDGNDLEDYQRPVTRFKIFQNSSLTRIENQR